MIAAHQTMMAPPSLPYDAEVEYIRADGTQFIDTGYYACETSGFDLVFTPRTFNSTNGWRCLFGARMANIGASTRINTLAIWMQSTTPNGTKQLALNDYPSYDSGGTGTGATLTKGTFTAKNRSLYYNGAFVRSSGQTATYRSTVTTGLLRCNNYDGFEVSNSRELPGDIYSFQILEGGVLQRDFIPVRVGTVGYLYDRANPTGGPNGNGLYGNAGTGNFTVGPDKT